jgi:Fe-S oxidoreductase
LLPGSGLENAYTPSFGLLEQESIIMEQSAIGEIADSISDCLRCGKCKPVCTTHVPRSNLLYSPRNKILATSLLIEAFLYEEQTRRGISIKHFDLMMLQIIVLFAINALTLVQLILILVKSLSLCEIS